MTFAVVLPVKFLKTGMDRQALALLSVCLAGCSTAPEPKPADLQENVAAYVAAYNVRDVERMLGMVTDDIRWMSIEDDGIAVVTEGKAALADALREYFAVLPPSQSRTRGMLTNGTFVAVIEQANWQSSGSQRSQCGVATYEFRDGLISNVWYHSGQPCDIAE